MNTNRFFVYLVMAFTVALSGCGGGAGPTRPDPGAVSEEKTDTRVKPDPGPEPDPKPCIQTKIETQSGSFICIDTDTYEERKNRFAREHRAKEGFIRQWGLGAVNADEAWAHVELIRGGYIPPGRGVTVGVIDKKMPTEKDDLHPFLERTSVKETIFDHVPAPMDEKPDGGRHATKVASIIAAQPHQDYKDSFYGVAWGANLRMFPVQLADPPPPGTPFTPVPLDQLKKWDPAYAGMFTTAAGTDVDILNMSWGVPGLIENHSEADLRTNIPDTIAALAQETAQDKKILVWAAGNLNEFRCTKGSDNCREVQTPDQELPGIPGGPPIIIKGKLKYLLDASSPAVLAGLPARIAELRGHYIAVVAVDDEGDIADRSNRCGIAADWCLAAPGEHILAAYDGPALGLPDPDTGEKSGASRYDGTSLAAPMVSGGLAVMKQIFRGQMSSAALVTRLFATADKNGKFADRAIYGQGMMNLGAAARPVGKPRVASGDTVAGAGISLQQTSLSLGRAFGNGLGRSLAGQEIAAFDSLGAPFWFKLDGFTGAASGPSSLVRLSELMEQTPITRRTDGRLTTFTPDRVGGAVEQDLGYARLRLGLRETPTGVEGGHFVLAQDATTLTLTGHNGMAATAFTSSGFAGRAPASGASLSWRPFDVPFGFRAGWLAEQETLLGTATAGAFGRLSADAMFAGLETGFAVGKWQLAADAELGTAVPRLQGGVISRMSSLTTSAFALHASRRLANGGSVRISLSQPLRVEDGRAALSIPIGRTKAGDVLRSSLAADLTPSGRQLDVSARWHHPLANGGELRFDAAWMRNPGHNARAKPAMSLMAGWLFEF